MASPATTSVETEEKSPGEAAPRTTGGSVAWVTRCRSASAARAGPGVTSSAVPTTRAAPDRSAIVSSQNAASNDGEANCSTRLSGPTSKRSVWAAIRLATPEWVTTTPLGRPVEPEV